MLSPPPGTGAPEEGTDTEGATPVEGAASSLPPPPATRSVPARICTHALVLVVTPVGLPTGTEVPVYEPSTVSDSIRPSRMRQAASSPVRTVRITYGRPSQSPMFSTSVREGRGGLERCEWKTASS
jgi:hypothetical protein